jgi:hypothetical protein
VDKVKKLIHFFRKYCNGYVSIEVVIIGGLVVGFGAFVIDALNHTGYTQVQNSVNTMNEKFNEPGIRAILDR